jgi:hypothetical protein
VNIFELTYLTLVIWVAAWVATLLSRTFDMHLLLASCIAAISMVVLFGLANGLKSRYVNSRKNKFTQD